MDGEPKVTVRDLNIAAAEEDTEEARILCARCYSLSHYGCAAPYLQFCPSYDGLSALDSCMQSVMLVIGVAVVHETPTLKMGFPT